MRVGISVSPTKSQFGPVLYEEDFDALCGYISGLGYAGIELSLISPAALTPQRERSITGHGLKVFSFATGQSYIQEGICLYSTSDDARAKAVGRLKSFIPVAQAHCCAIIVGGIRGNERVPEELLPDVKAKGDAALLDVAESAAKQGITLLLEPINRYESRFYNSVSSCAHFIRYSAMGNIRILADTFHMNIEEPSILGTVSAHLPVIGYVHIADSNRLFPGAGHIDFASFFSTVQSGEFAGVIGLEVLPLPDIHEAASRSFRNLQSFLKEE
ncbi:MAG: sugar phosphate isomerase/epimerase family protein [Spirochaetia bacterium]|jgi:sugar phosphate isomerase/epimerase